MVLQYSSVGKSLLWLSSYYYFVQCQSRDFLTELCCNIISCFTTFYCIDPYFIFKLTILVKTKVYQRKIESTLVTCVFKALVKCM